MKPEILLTMFCIDGVFTVALHSRSGFFLSLGIFERSHCLTATKYLRSGGSHQTGVYKHPKNNGPESNCCKGLEVPQVYQSKILERFVVNKSINSIS